MQYFMANPCMIFGLVTVHSRFFIVQDLLAHSRFWHINLWNNLSHGFAG